MRPSPSFDWERALTPARWVAGIVGGGALVIWAGTSILYVLGAFGAMTAAAPSAMQYLLWGVLGVGLILALFWKGIGEAIGGLALIGGAVWVAANGGFEFGAITAATPFALAGALFIACGWYRLAQRNRRATHAMA